MKKIINNVIQRGFIKEGFWYILSQGYTQITSFVALFFISRYLGPVQLGLFSFTQTYLSMFIAVISGVDFYYSWKIARSKEKFDEVRKSLYVKTVLLLILAGIALLSAFVFLPSDVFVLMCAYTLPMLGYNITGVYYYLVAEKKAHIVSFVTIFCSTALLLLKMVFVYLKAPLYLFLFTAALDVTLLHFILGFIFIGQLDIKKMFTDRYFYRHLLDRDALRTIMYSVFFMLSLQFLLRFDQFVVAFFTNAYSLGIYSAAVKIAETPNMIAGVLATLSLSRIPNLLNIEEKKYELLKIKKILIIYIIISISFALFLIAGSGYIIKFLYGEMFYDSIAILKAYALSIPGLFCTYYFISIYAGLDQKLLLAKQFSSVTFLCILFTVPAVVFFGIFGVAIATVISYTILAFVLYVTLKLKFKIF